MIYGARVCQARLFLAENQTQFARAVGLSQPRLSSIETSVQQSVSDDVLLAMAEHAGFLPEFFSYPPAGDIDDVQFRARLTFRAADRHRAMSCANLVHETYSKMRQMVEVVPVKMQRSRGVEARRAAREFRVALGLPSGPVLNLTSPVERIGVALLSLPIIGKKHDAFSTWHASGKTEYPLIVTFAGSPGDRVRWSVAHELGHLVLHDSESGKEIEAEADTFAAELLTPIEAMAVEIPMRPKLAALYAMKIRWGVSVQSLIRRAREVGRVNDDQYMSLFRQVSARGERMSERYQIPREKPRLYRKMAEVLYGESPAAGLADLGCWTEEFAQDVLDQFASKSEIPSRRVFYGSRPANDMSNVVEFRRPRRT